MIGNGLCRVFFYGWGERKREIFSYVGKNKPVFSHISGDVFFLTFPSDQNVIRVVLIIGIWEKDADLELSKLGNSAPFVST